MMSVQAVCITADRREEWNTFVAQEPSFALLQSWEWGEFKEKLGWKAFRIAVEEQGQIVAGAQMLVRPVPLGLASVAYVPRGPLGNWLDEEIRPPLLSELQRVARHHRAVFLRFEPPLLNDPTIGRILGQHRFRASAYTNQPCATIIVDLAQGLDDILAHMRRSTRYSIRYAAKQGVTVQAGNVEDLEVFCRLMQITGRRGGFRPRALNYYRHQWETFAPLGWLRLFVASYQGKILAMNVSTAFGGHAIYLHGASSGEYSNLTPNHLLLWEAIQWAKAQNCRTYDLWGIPDEVAQAVYKGQGAPVSDRTDGLWGVYRFKSGFSKDIVCYVGAYDQIYSPLLYALITNKVFNKDRLDRIAVWMDLQGQ